MKASEDVMCDIWHQDAAEPLNPVKFISPVSGHNVMTDQCIYVCIWEGYGMLTGVGGKDG